MHPKKYEEAQRSKHRLGEDYCQRHGCRHHRLAHAKGGPCKAKLGKGGTCLCPSFKDAEVAP